MSDVTFTLNGEEVTADSSKTIYQVADERGVFIPTLCYLRDLSPTGACRVCVVEIEGARTLAASCHTPVGNGMVIHTDSPKVLEARRVIMELLLASHCGNCFLCEKANICELRRVSTGLDIAESRFLAKKRYSQIEDVSPYVTRDMSKCILCRRCVRVCNEQAHQNIFSVAYRGFGSKVVVDFDDVLNKDVCKDCQKCIPVCPTGALSKPLAVDEKKQGPPLLVQD